MIYTSIARFNIFLERKHEIHLLFTLYKKKLVFKSTTILMPFREGKKRKKKNQTRHIGFHRKTGLKTNHVGEGNGTRDHPI